MNYLAAAPSGSAAQNLILGVACLAWGVGMVVRNRRTLRAAAGAGDVAGRAATQRNSRRILLACGWVLAVCGVLLSASGVALSLGAS